MDADLQRRRQLGADLRSALTEGQLDLHYQPIVAADGSGPRAYEALLRWRHPREGFVSPGEFIPIAEATGQIRRLGAWALARACTDAAAWPAHLKVAVNLSPVQFVGDALVEEVAQTLAASGLPAERLELEITESVLLQDDDATLAILHRLRALGVSTAMDDFGTGYSSLSYLRRFPFDKIKIDQSFVRNLGHETGSSEIVRAAVGLGKTFGMIVLAEGVETEEQAAILREAGCDELQGYLFGRPCPVDEVRDLAPMGRAAA
ncbi:EAL domain, c-di-GMP-specific phosphodiesterase class I (or its enzymatically inactive variant) [Methylobacterium sp. ap11]|uniref:putative bifunctional diguanylate cyclase/phosphodiesterase n=1 Tax=Methylobacterium sp. ap11 TaxID=1761799 RepID=UPI0008CAA3E1|nr:EAL domain-containing protein [Methylobacterium sp. ap11]SEO76445.1 EAL domain, c-di-GMP-specific phosphodiesterase class I (or its enzymatically inactive variant) [Methylobacterium sp. ap11]